MSKTCGQCHQPYKGFGAVCAPCRRAPSEAKAAATPRSPDTKPDHCNACGKRVYVMEQKQVEGLLFHKDCFKCTTCDRKLDGNFGKSELGFFCLTHFHEIAKLTAGYKSGTGPTRNSVAAGLVDALVHRRPPTLTSGEETNQSAAASEVASGEQVANAQPVASEEVELAAPRDPNAAKTASATDQVDSSITVPPVSSLDESVENVGVEQAETGEPVSTQIVASEGSLPPSDSRTDEIVAVSVPETSTEEAEKFPSPVLEADSVGVADGSTAATDSSPSPPPLEVDAHPHADKEDPAEGLASSG